MQIVVDGLLTQYELSGKGQLVLLLHGWGDSLKTFAELRKRLTANYQVLAVDLPGFGGTQVPKETWDLDNYAAFLENLLKKLELSQPYAVIGHSNGGALAIRAISLDALKPQKLVLIAASGIRTAQKARRLILKVLAKAGNIATIWMPERYRRALRKSLYEAAGSDLLVMPGLEETFKKTVRQDVQKDAVRIKIPALLIYAKNDEAVPLSYGRLYKSYITHSRLEEVEDAGHFVHLDQTEKVNMLIKDFLK
jgi:pimeloyl-ACP methyl ester carboxylesterase